MSRSAIAVHHQRVDVKEFGAKALIGAVIVLSVTLLSLAVVTMRGESPALLETSMPFVEPVPAEETTPVAKIQPKRLTVRPVPVRKTLNLPQGTVTVPEINLRQAHAFNAKTFGVKLHKGEKVSIHRRFVPQAGPAWVQVQRASGQSGWVLASTVQQKKARM